MSSLCVLLLFLAKKFSLMVGKVLAIYWKASIANYYHMYTLNLLLLLKKNTFVHGKRMKITFTSIIIQRKFFDQIFRMSTLNENYFMQKVFAQKFTRRKRPIMVYKFVTTKTRLYFGLTLCL